LVENLIPEIGRKFNNIFWMWDDQFKFLSNITPKNFISATAVIGLSFIVNFKSNWNLLYIGQFELELELECT